MTDRSALPPGREPQDDDFRSALRALVSCVRRDQGKGGILLPTEAALSRAEELLSAPVSTAPASGETPRTDAAEFTHTTMRDGVIVGEQEVVDANVARQLERELRAAQSATKTIRYQRAPEYDRRNAHGDDYAGDAYVRWVTVGHKPDDAWVIEAPLTETQPSQDWIPVGERLPGDSVRVLACWNSGFIYCAYYSNGEWLNTSGQATPSQRVTHWMPLPAAPVAEGRERG